MWMCTLEFDTRKREARAIREGTGVVSSVDGNLEREAKRRPPRALVFAGVRRDTMERRRKPIGGFCGE